MTIIQNSQRFITYTGDTFQINFKLDGLQAGTTYNAHFTINSSPVIEYEKDITADSEGAADISFFVEKTKTSAVKSGIYSFGLKLCNDIYSDTVYKYNIQFLARVAGNNCND